MMKKTVYILLTLVCLFSFIGCKKHREGFDLVEYIVSMEENDEYTGYIQEIDSLNTEYFKSMQYDRENEIYKYVYETKTLNPFEAEEQYNIVREEEYYGNNRRYYLEDETWKSEEHNSSSGAMLYSFKREYFEDDMKLPKLTEEARFEGKLLDDKVDDFFGKDVDAKDVTVIVVFNALTQKLKEIRINYQTPSNETITIVLSINYEQVLLTLPA